VIFQPFHFNVTQLYSNITNYMPHSQGLSNNPYPEPNEQPHTVKIIFVQKRHTGPRNWIDNLELYCNIPKLIQIPENSIVNLELNLKKKERVRHLPDSRLDITGAERTQCKDKIYRAFSQHVTHQH
jgi:hypothetical protein